MSCLLPQFMCHPDTFCLQFRTHHYHHSANQTNISKHKEHLCFKTQCILAAASLSVSTVTVCDAEKLRLPPVEAHSNSVAANRPWTYIGGTDQPAEARFRAPLASDTLLTSDEAVIAAASAEAVALARAAVEVAKDAVLMINNSNFSRTETNTAFSYGSDVSPTKLSLFTEAERAGIVGVSPTAEKEVNEDYYVDDFIKESDDNIPTDEDLELLEHQLPRSIAVRSRRQNERKAKRAREGKKASTNVVSVQAGSSSRKKRGSSKDVDCSDPLRYWSGKSFTSKLLTSAEEVQLSEGIQDLIKLEGLQKELEVRCGDQPTFAQWAAAARVDQRTLTIRLHHGSLCKKKMVMSNIRLVISIAKNYQGLGMSFPDLIQEGVRGLIRATERFDASKGFKFSTYAHWWIKLAVRKCLSVHSRLIHLPRHMVEASYKVRKARKNLYEEKRREPTNEEVAEAAGISMKRLNAVLLIPKAPQSLDRKIGINKDLKLSDIISDPKAETDEELLVKQLKKRDLEKMIDGLKPRQKQVLRSRYGLEDGRIKTLQEIGESIGVSRERIRQLEAYAFRKLKNDSRTKVMQYYL